jgi:hypothetical protein
MSDSVRKATLRGRAWMRHPLASIVAFALFGAVFGLVRWGLEPSHAAGDSFWYARAALELRGDTEDEATRAAAEFIVGEGRASDPEAYVTYARTIDPRYPAIFESRPIYPVIVAAFLTIAELRAAMALAALLAGIVFSTGFGWFVQRATGSLAAALGAVVIAFVLPSGRWFAFMLADGWMLAFGALALAFGSLYLLDPRPRYLAAALVSIVMTYLTKPANGAVLVVAFALIGVGAWAFGSPSRKQAGVLAVAAGLVGLTQVAAFAILGLPGFETTLQDMFTSHFSNADVADPLQRLLGRDLEVVRMALAFPLQEPLTVLLLAGLLAPLVAIRRSWAAAWLVAAFASALTVLAHPVTTEFPRLLAPIWVSAALGGGLWMAWALRGSGEGSPASI